MNPPSDTPDPLLKSLIDDAADLPCMAASVARQLQSRRDQNRRRLIRGLAIAILGAFSWQALNPFLPAWKKAESSTNRVPLPPVPAKTRLPAFVKVQTMDEAMSEPLPTPLGATQEQKDLIEAARDLPLLLVMDASGKLTKICVIER